MDGITDTARTEATSGPFPVRHGPARSLPAWTYTDPEFLQLEMEQVLMPSWQIVCHANDLPASGDYKIFNMLQESVIVTRDRDGELRAFHNVCRHRGSRLLDDAGRIRGLIVCPYHGWSYDLQGQLRGVPEKASFPDLDTSCLGLKAVTLEVFLGFVFVRLRDNGGLSVAQMWQPYREELERHRLSDMQPLTAIGEDIWDCNWKTAVDNNLECYHIPMGHPGLNRMFGTDYDISVEETGVSRGISRFKAQLSSEPSEREYQERVVDVATHLPEEMRKAWLFYAMLPNLGVDVYPDSMDFFQILPIGPQQCVARWCIYALPDKRAEMQALRRLNWKISGKVMEEDQVLSRRVQQGVRSYAYEPGPLSEHEICLRQFHDSIRQALPVSLREQRPKGRPLADVDADMRETQQTQ